MNDAERNAVIRKVKTSINTDPVKSESSKEYRVAAEPVIRELAELGYQIESIDDLRHLGRSWKSALPVLLKWLPSVRHLGVKEGIVRALSVPWIGNKATAVLIDEFERSDSEQTFAWVVGNALSIVGVEGFEEQILGLSKNPEYGTARQMIVLGLGRLRNSEAEEVALSLLGDEGVKLHAIVALGKMRSRRALPRLEELLSDKRAVVRKEARKAIKNVNA